MPLNAKPPALAPRAARNHVSFGRLVVSENSQQAAVAQDIAADRDENAARRKAPPLRQVEPVDVEVYDGRIALGRVHSTDEGYRAFDDAGADLGLFNTAKTATQAILAAWRDRGER